MASSGSYLVAGARTPIGKMSGALASFSAAELGGFAIAAALERAGVAPEEVEHVLMGQVLMAGAGQVPSRQAAFKAGNVAVLVGDWTRNDPAIGRFLEAQGRSGVPLYLYYAKGGAAVVLPQVLTPATLTDLVNN